MAEFHQKELDADLSVKLDRKGKVFDAPTKLFGIAKIEGRYVCVRALMDAQGKVQEIRQYHHAELEHDYAQDHLRREFWEQERVTL